MACISVLAASVLTFVLSAALLLFATEPVYGQANIDNSLADKQKMGTDNILYPTDVRILFSNVQNIPLHQQFVMLGNNNNDTSHGTLFGWYCKECNFFDSDDAVHVVVM
jgi:hypothetical protein